MICYPKRNMDKNMMSKLSSAVMLVGGIMAIAYYGWKLAEKMKCYCKKKSDCGCIKPDPQEYSHFSENDYLSHDHKEYYGKCGCFDNPDGCPDEEDEE